MHLSWQLLQRWYSCQIQPAVVWEDALGSNQPSEAGWWSPGARDKCPSLRRAVSPQVHSPSLAPGQTEGATLWGADRPISSSPSLIRRRYLLFSSPSILSSLTSPLQPRRPPCSSCIPPSTVLPLKLLSGYCCYWISVRLSALLPSLLCSVFTQ